MGKLKCYLAGPIQSAADSGEGWRKEITPKLEDMNVTVLNPNKIERKDLRHSAAVTQKILKESVRKRDWDTFDKIVHTIQVRDLKAVRNSDFLIVLLDPDVRMGGTVAEIEYARSLHIPVFGVCEKELERENYWVIHTIHDSDGKIFQSFKLLLEFLSEEITKGRI